MAHVERLHEMKADKPSMNLVMEQSNLQIIKALSQRQLAAKAAWSADAIEDKGKGVIVLLHGKHCH
jgi:hypothetical protein